MWPGMLTDCFFPLNATAEQQWSGAGESAGSLHASTGPLAPPQHGQTGVSLDDGHQANHHILRR